MRSRYLQVKDLFSLGMDEHEIKLALGLSDRAMERYTQSLQRSEEGLQAMGDDWEYLERRIKEEAGPVKHYRMSPEEIEERYGGGA